MDFISYLSWKFQSLEVLTFNKMFATLLLDVLFVRLPVEVT